MVTMGMNNIFVRWWVSFSILTVAITTTLLAGIGKFITTHDCTFISWGILGMAFGASLHLGYKLRAYAAKPSHKRDFKVTEYFIDTCTSLGLLGTIIGLIMMVVGAFGDLDVTNQASVKSSMLAISSGIGSALVTTLVGLVCALLLRFQLVITSEKWRA